MLHLPKLIQNNDDRRKNLKINIIGDHEEYNEIIEKSTIEEIEIKKTSTKDENEKENNEEFIDKKECFY